MVTFGLAERLIGSHKFLLVKMKTLYPKCFSCMSSVRGKLLYVLFFTMSQR